MGRRLKAIVIGEISAPYRVDVFKEMTKFMDMEIFFQDNKDQSRNPDYFVKSDQLPFLILDNKEGESEFKKALKDIKKFDILIAYHPVCKAALQAEWVCRRNDIPYFVNVDGAFVNPNLIKDTIKKWIYKGAAGCFSGGKSATQYFLHYGVKKEKIFEYGFTCLHPEDIEDTVPSHEAKAALRKELEIEDRKTVISVGQFIPRKGFDILLEAWRNIDTSDAQLFIIGGGPEQLKYETFIREHNLNNVLLIDFMIKEKLKKFYLASDIFVLPTREDVWGLVINEAMAFGLPVITTKMCNAGTQLIEDGENGYIVPLDVEKLAEKINVLINKESLSEMGQRNIKKITEYTIENAVKSHLAAIKEIIVSQKRRTDDEFM